MEQIHEQRIYIGPSMCDADRLLSHHAAFNLLQDVAITHATQFGLGLADLEKHSLHWLIVRIKIVFERRPAFGEEIVLRTWAEAPGRLRCNRSFEMLRDGEILLRVHTEWAVYNSAAGRVEPCANIFPPELAYDLPAACAESLNT